MTTLRTTTWAVRELATLAGVSVRTLHHYHHIGLLLPARVGDNGYRHYGTAELVRLQQILFLRELEFPLDRIRELLDQPGFEATAAYRDHRRLLVARREQLDDLIATLDRQLGHEEDHMTERRPLDANQLNDAQRETRRASRFTAEELDALREEARRRWGGSDAWRQSEQRTDRHTDQNWDTFRGRWDADMRALVADMPKGISSPEVQAHVAGYRDWLRNFYEPSDEIFRGLATMFVDDDRYAETFRRYHPDLPVFLRDAMRYSLGDRP